MSGWLHGAAEPQGIVAPTLRSARADLKVGATTLTAEEPVAEKAELSSGTPKSSLAPANLKFRLDGREVTFCVKTLVHGKLHIAVTIA